MFRPCRACHPKFIAWRDPRAVTNCADGAKRNAYLTNIQKTAG
jgi:hypothetical protein